MAAKIIKAKEQLGETGWERCDAGWAGGTNIPDGPRTRRQPDVVTDPCVVACPVAAIPPAMVGLGAERVAVVMDAEGVVLVAAKVQVEEALKVQE